MATSPVATSENPQRRTQRTARTAAAAPSNSSDGGCPILSVLCEGWGF
ncbi:MAG: hypothetical protein ACYC92_14235 [Candidatus Acidiferrales bacterium]